ncbi:MAG: hypothetical protein JEZ00_10015 [Anaerolineaceae bacterium]|nr:hypothetical protein [Anaerolineaceae bacterium]
MQWTLYTGAPDQPDAEVIMDEDIAWQLFTRGISAQQAKEQALIKGDQPLAMKIFEMVSIIA